MAEGPNPPKSGVGKRFVPLENNPEVMSKLMHNLGMSEKLDFHDVYSIDEPDLLAIVPRPAHALLLVFPVSETYENFRRQEDADKQEYNGSGEGEPVVWYKQTIGNACGLIGLLHGVSNGQARSYINARSLTPARQNPEPDSDLARLVDSAISRSPVERANLLYESQALETAHQSAAAGGDTAAPEAEQSVDLHYVCFVKDKRGRLWEMDGRRKGPLDRGVLDAGDDVLSEKALELGVRRFIDREIKAGGGEQRFSLIALAQGFD
ncbi:hypothetical protein BDY21DRAFT_301217 [Lineolata rhizophorae]|uniref:Ubiquitin carboxyl-terminal hydrolase n=1 Tax=Lineolata rhizophorae TaxID=578093 RepID=A0A6A6P5B2_9PEZI|nr:hypothetical protein BDY21DRAFT_301217 [Lineolata rhizophorae]